MSHFFSLWTWEERVQQAGNEWGKLIFFISLRRMVVDGIEMGMNGGSKLIAGRKWGNLHTAYGGGEKLSLPLFLTANFFEFCTELDFSSKFYANLARALWPSSWQC